MEVKNKLFYEEYQLETLPKALRTQALTALTNLHIEHNLHFLHILHSLHIMLSLHIMHSLLKYPSQQTASWSQETAEHTAANFIVHSLYDFGTCGHILHLRQK